MDIVKWFHHFQNSSFSFWPPPFTHTHTHTDGGGAGLTEKRWIISGGSQEDVEVSNSKTGLKVEHGVVSLTVKV